MDDHGISHFLIFLAQRQSAGVAQVIFAFVCVAMNADIKVSKHETSLRSGYIRLGLDAGRKNRDNLGFCIVQGTRGMSLELVRVHSGAK